MRAKPLLIAAGAAGVGLFFWGFLWNAVLPFSAGSMREFTDNDAVVAVVGANAPENGVYLSPQGILAAVSFLPDKSDKSASMGSNIAIELLADVILALLLGMLLLRLRPKSVFGGAFLLMPVALAAAVSERVSDWNWFGFSAQFTLAGTFELLVGWFLVGLVLGAVLLRGIPADDRSVSSTS